MQKAEGYNSMAAAIPSPTWMIVAWLKRMHVDVIIDHVLELPPGHWEDWRKWGIGPRKCDYCGQMTDAIHGHYWPGDGGPGSQ